MVRTIWSVAGALRVTFLALLVGATWPLAAHAGSTKFIPTFLVYYGGGPALGASDAARLAKFDLIDLDRFRYQDINGNTWAAVKADIIDQPWQADGIFADNCLAFANGGGYHAASATYPTDAAWSAAMNAFSSAIAAGLHNYGQKLWCNKGGSGTAAGSAAWL